MVPSWDVSCIFSSVPVKIYQWVININNKKILRRLNNVSSPFLSTGPTAIASLLTYQAAGGVWQKAVLLSFLTGLIEIIMGFCGLGFLLNFVSGPVSSGFTSAVSLIILSSQVKDILGIKAQGTTFVAMWSSIFDNIHNIRINDTCMGISCIIILLLMRLLVNIKIGPKEDEMKSSFHNVMNKIIWLIGTARNAILVILTGTISYLLQQSGQNDLQVIGYIPPGMPSVQVPPFSIPEIRNETTGELIQKGETFIDMISDMGSSLIVIPLIALLENMAVCKAFGNYRNKLLRIILVTFSHTEYGKSIYFFPFSLVRIYSYFFIQICSSFFSTFCSPLSKDALFTFSTMY